MESTNNSRASDRQVEANRRNARKSTGPRTPAGKDVTRLNALRGGATAGTPLLPGEDASERDALCASVTAALAPEDAYQSSLVEAMVSDLWGLRRIERIETALLRFRILEDAQADAERAIYGTSEPAEPILSADYKREALPETVAAREVHREVTSALEDEPVTLGRAFLRDALNGDALGRLSRYETSKIRNLQRTWALLDAAQNAKRRSAVAATKEGHVQPLTLPPRAS
jgi:hypothetical protein